MMWALKVTVCLVAGHSAACHEWISDPVMDKRTCEKMVQSVTTPVDAAQPMHLGACCELGWYA